MALADQIILRGTRAAQPAAASLTAGAIYFVTDESVTERSTGAAWESFSPTTVGGNVTAAGTLTSGQLVIGQGTKAVAVSNLTGDVTTAGGVATTIAANAVTTAKLLDANVTLAKIASAAANSKLVGSGAAGVGVAYAELTLGTNLSMTGTTLNAAGGAGAVVQVVNTQTGAVATGTTVIPADDTIPQNTEGTEFMTLAVTPTDAANMLKIDVVFLGASNTAARNVCVALFQDTTASALAVGDQTTFSGGYIQAITFSHYMTAGTTSATTFKVRAGVETSGTVTFNGSSGNRFYGGVMASSITITEIVP